MPTKRTRFMVNIPPEREEAVRKRAKQLNRSVANYLEWLVTEDLGPTHLTEEEQAPYHGPVKVAPPPKPPDKSQRFRGDGPHRAVPKSA